MASIIGTVVNESLMLIGLKVKGKHCEIYGGSNTTRIEARCTLDELLKRKLKTAQMSFAGERPLILGQFKLTDVPMEIYLGGNYQPFNNLIEVTGRITNGKKDVGYEIVDCNGTKYQLPTEKIDQMTLIMRPRNFVVRHDEAGKPFLAAKSGSIAQLPVIADLANRSAQGSDKRRVQKADPANLSFEGILNMIASMNGFFAYVPGFIYRAYSKQSAAEKAANESLYSGQLAVPAIVPTVSSANINLRFRGLAKVEVPRSGGQAPLELFPNLYREKSVYRNGKLALDTVGILVEAKHGETVMSTLAGASPFDITDQKILEYFSRILGRTPGQIKLIGISLIGVKPYESIKPVDYNALAFAVNNYDQVSDALKACKKIQKEALASTGAKFSEVHSSLKSFSDEELSDIALAGIDIKSFTLVKKAKEEDNAASEEEIARAKAYEKSVKLGWSVKLTDAAAAKKAQDIQDLVNEATGYAQAGEGDKLGDFIKGMDDAADALKKSLWEANKAVLSAGEKKIMLPTDNTGIAMADVTTARMTSSKAAAANTTVPGIEQLKLTVSNATDSEFVF